METAIIIAIIGGLGGFITASTTAVFKILEWKKTQRGETWEAKLDEKLAPMLNEHKFLREQNVELRDALREIRLDTTRIQLLDIMHDEPKNHDTILTIAHRYFVELQGDWVASVEFQSWADREKIKIPGAISQAIVENDKK